MVAMSEWRIWAVRGGPFGSRASALDSGRRYRPARSPSVCTAPTVRRGLCWPRARLGHRSG